MNGAAWARLGLAAVIAASWLLAAPQATPPATAQVVGLTLVSPTVNNFTTVALDGTPRTTTAGVSSFSVSDVRPVASGWRLTVSATQVCEQLVLATCAINPKTLPVGSLDLSSPSVSGPAPMPTVTAAVGIDGSAAPLASAAVATGLGTYSFSTSTLTLRFPANSYARTYVSTVTWTIAAGP